MKTAYPGKQFHLASIAGVDVLVPEPDQPPSRRFIGHQQLVRKCLAAWDKLPGCHPLHFRLEGPPGVGKNELVAHLAREKGLPFYSMVGNEEMTPEDLVCTARLVGNGVEYIASALVAAMLIGGTFCFDEIGKAPPRSLSVLSSVLDDRRTISSTLAGFTLTAAPEFRFCAALNTEDLAGLPRYIDDRLRPIFKVNYPPVDDLMTIIRENTPGVSAPLLTGFHAWVARHEGNLSPRQALTLVGYAARLERSNAKCGTLSSSMANELVAEAARAIGQEE